MQTRTHSTPSLTHPTTPTWCWAVGCTALYAVIEWIGGDWTHALSLMSDAGHMLTDAAALALAWCAHRLKQYCAQHGYTLGHGLAEPLSALLSACLMFGVVVTIVIAAYQRFDTPVAIMATPVMLIATGGLLVNLMVAHCLAPHGQNLNVRAAQLHIWADMLGSLAALLAGMIAHVWQWPYADLIFSLLIGLVIGVLSLSIIVKSTHNIHQIWLTRFHKRCAPSDIETNLI